MESFGFSYTLEAIALDSGYMTPHICMSTLSMNLFPVIAERKPFAKEGTFSKAQFSYDANLNMYLCPVGKSLTYSGTNRSGYREYRSDPAKCVTCPLSNKSFNDTSGKILKSKLPATNKVRTERQFTSYVVKPLSEASRMPKCSTGFAVADFVDKAKPRNKYS